MVITISYTCILLWCCTSRICNYQYGILCAGNWMTPSAQGQQLLLKIVFSDCSWSNDQRYLFPAYEQHLMNFSEDSIVRKGHKMHWRSFYPSESWHTFHFVHYHMTILEMMIGWCGHHQSFKSQVARRQTESYAWLICCGFFFVAPN